MPENQAAPPQQAAPDQRPQVQGMLPTQQANHFTFAVTPSEILVGLGQSRTAVSQTPTGAALKLVVEWLLTVSISPVAASHLAQSLTETLKVYEQKFGKIPIDPNFKMTVGDAAQRPG